MNEPQGGEVRRRRSSAEAAQLAADYENSGLSRQEFCRNHGLSLATLNRYRSRLQQAGGDNRWVRVELAGELAGAAGALALVLSGGHRVEVGRGFDAQTLRRLVDALERQ